MKVARFLTQPLPKASTFQPGLSCPAMSNFSLFFRFELQCLFLYSHILFCLCQGNVSSCSYHFCILNYTRRTPVICGWSQRCHLRSYSCAPELWWCWVLVVKEKKNHKILVKNDKGHFDKNIIAGETTNSNSKYKREKWRCVASTQSEGGGDVEEELN